MVGAEGKLDVAAPGDIQGGFHGAGKFTKRGLHLGPGLEEELVGAKLEAVGVVDGLAGLDAQQHVMGAHVFLAQVVAVVGGHQGDGHAPAQLAQPLVDPVLDLHAVVLDFQVEVALAENLQVRARGRLGLVHAAVLDAARHLAVQAGRKPDEPAAVLTQDLLVDAWTVVETLELGDGGQPAQVAVALHVLGQQDQVAHSLLVLGAAVLDGPRRHVSLHADDGLDAGRHGLLVELQPAEHGAVVGDGHGLHAVLGGLLQEGINADGAVEQAVLGVHVQVNEGGLGFGHGSEILSRRVAGD